MACGADSCGACQQLDGKRFALDKLPEMPYEKCTCEVGCRCLLTAVIPGQSGTKTRIPRERDV
jgi:hypothetical protein